MVRQLNGDSLPARAVDSIVDGGLMELEGGTANAVRRGWKALALDQLPGIRSAETKEVALDNSGKISDLASVDIMLWVWVKVRYFNVNILFPIHIYNYRHQKENPKITAHKIYSNSLQADGCLHRQQHKITAFKVLHSNGFLPRYCYQKHTWSCLTQFLVSRNLTHYNSFLKVVGDGPINTLRRNCSVSAFYLIWLLCFGDVTGQSTFRSFID